jgi:hypothetical protein
LRLVRLIASLLGLPLGALVKQGYHLAHCPNFWDPLYWLLFYGMLEIGIRSGMLRSELPRTFLSSAKQEFEATTEYFWTGLDLPLLSEVQRRIFGGETRQIEEGSQAHYLFQRFVILNSSIRSDPYLGILSEFTKFDFISFRTELEHALESPSNYLAIFKTPSETMVKRVLLGVSRSFYFLPELFNLIEVAGETNPYIAESIRSYNRHWTDLLSSATGEWTVATILDAFEKWARKAKDPESLKEIEAVRTATSKFQLQIA